MALAALFSQLQTAGHLSADHQNPGFSPLQSLREVTVQAFVVDHDVRTGSDVEAKAVSRVLERRGKF